LKNSYIFVDTSAFVAWLWLDDSFHKEAEKQFALIEKKKRIPITSSYVIDETATVLSHREGQLLARQFLISASRIPTIFITEDLRSKTIDLFSNQKLKGTSIVDCSNVVAMQDQDIDTIFTYDAVFAKVFHLQVVLP